MSFGRVGLTHRLSNGIRSIVSISLALLAALVVGGCTSNSAHVTLAGDQGKTVYAQSFAHAYIASPHAGEYDVILMQDSQPKPKTNYNPVDYVKSMMPGAAAKTNKPLEPMSSAELRQIVHIHIFWQADTGTVARDGVVTNAAINWYMIAHEASDHPEVLQYEGAGVVTLDAGRQSTSVEIRDGTMKKTQLLGGMKDPLGPSHLNGVVKAEHNAQIVRDVLADLKARRTGQSVALGTIR